MAITLLAIESSCDETAAAVITDSLIKSNIIATQSIHKAYGGVVPELASRAHQKNIVPVVDKAIKDSGMSIKDLNCIACTQGPGLLGSLLVGISFAKAMAMALNIPIIGVNHLQAHVLSHFIKDPKPQFPFICLIVSGGHTQLVLVNNFLCMEVIGQTQDDAVGEAFDKTAKIMGLPYPGGAMIDKFSQKGNPYAFIFPNVKMQRLDFSFSGIKTAFLYFIQKNCRENSSFIQENLLDICASVQHTLVKILLEKLVMATKKYKINRVAIAGGVSSNSKLRKELQMYGEQHKWEIFIPDFEYCTDNAAMIAINAYYKYLANEFSSQDITAMARMKL